MGKVFSPSLSFISYTKGAFSLSRRVLPLLCVLIPIRPDETPAPAFLREGWKSQLQLANHGVTVSTVQKPKVPDGSCCAAGCESSPSLKAPHGFSAVEANPKLIDLQRKTN